MEIISANKTHLDILVSLNSEVQNLHVGFEPGIFKTPSPNEIKTFFNNLLKKGNWKILISFDAEQPTGYISLQIGGHEEHPFCYSQKWLYIDHICVKKEFQKKGIGSLLIEAAKEYAKKQNINQIMLDVWRVNQNAINFFEKKGFKTIMERMKIEL